MRNYKNKNILIYGYGKSGKAVYNYLKNITKNIVIFDEKLTVEILENNNKIKNQLQNNNNKMFTNYNFNFSAIFENKFDNIKFQKFHFCILSPGVSIFHPDIIYLKNNNVKIISELEFGASFCKGKIFAITGTNGKTTTVSLLYHIFKTAKKSTFLCGNVGTPITEIASKTKKESLIVCEVSSFQMEATKTFKPFASCILNVSDDHFDRHKNMENYCFEKNKTNKFFKSKKIFNIDDNNVQKLANKYYFSIKCSKNKKINGAYIKRKNIYYKNEKVVPLSYINLIGKKNLENILCAIALAKQANISNKDIRKAIQDFMPLPNRLETVARFKDIIFINDSKSTNILSTLCALESISGNIILLLGGSNKDLDFSPIFEKQIYTTIIYGEVANKIYAVAKNTVKHKLPNFKTACEFAFSIAKPGDTVLLSPACASFDEFTSYEQRGKVFKNYVKKFLNFIDKDKIV